MDGRDSGISLNEKDNMTSVYELLGEELSKDNRTMRRILLDFGVQVAEIPRMALGENRKGQIFEEKYMK